MLSDKTNLNDTLIAQEAEVALPSRMPTLVRRIQQRAMGSELVLDGENFGVPSQRDRDGRTVLGPEKRDWWRSWEIAVGWQHIVSQRQR